jgi:hypothetical protein
VLGQRRLRWSPSGQAAPVLALPHASPTAHTTNLALLATPGPVFAYRILGMTNSSKENSSARSQRHGPIEAQAASKKADSERDITTVFEPWTH